MDTTSCGLALQADHHDSAQAKAKLQSGDSENRKGLLHASIAADYDPITVELQLCQSQWPANKTCDEHRKGD